MKKKFSAVALSLLMAGIIPSASASTAVAAALEETGAEVTVNEDGTVAETEDSEETSAEETTETPAETEAMVEETAGETEEESGDGSFVDQANHLSLIAGDGEVSETPAETETPVETLPAETEAPAETLPAETDAPSDDIGPGVPTEAPAESETSAETEAPAETAAGPSAGPGGTVTVTPVTPVETETPAETTATVEETNAEAEKPSKVGLIPARGTGTEDCDIAPDSFVNIDLDEDTKTRYEYQNVDTVVLPSVTKEGYTFLYWTEDPKDESGKTYEAGSTYTIKSEDDKLYAIFETPDGELIVEGDGGEEKLPAENAAVRAAKAAPEETETPVPAGPGYTEETEAPSETKAEEQAPSGSTADETNATSEETSPAETEQAVPEETEAPTPDYNDASDENIEETSASLETEASAPAEGEAETSAEEQGDSFVDDANAQSEAEEKASEPETKIDPQKIEAIVENLPEETVAE